MATAPTESSTTGILGPDPGRMIRCWVALFLRIGVGLSLLTAGLAGYFGRQAGGLGVGGPSGQGLSFVGLDPFLSGLPYLAIGLGLALILGFLTTASAIASAFFSLLMPMFAIVQIVGAGASGGMNFSTPYSNDPSIGMMMAMNTLPSLIPFAALIWLSPLENHPYSVDALIFGREEIELIPRPQESPPPGPPDLEPESTIRIGE